MKLNLKYLNIFNIFGNGVKTFSRTTKRKMTLYGMTVSRNDTEPNDKGTLRRRIPKQNDCQSSDIKHNHTENRMKMRLELPFAK